MMGLVWCLCVAIAVVAGNLHDHSTVMYVYLYIHWTYAANICTVHVDLFVFICAIQNRLRRSEHIQSLRWLIWHMLFKNYKQEFWKMFNIKFATMRLWTFFYNSLFANFLQCEFIFIQAVPRKKIDFNVYFSNRPYMRLRILAQEPRKLDGTLLEKCLETTASWHAIKREWSQKHQVILACCTMYDRKEFRTSARI